MDVDATRDEATRTVTLAGGVATAWAADAAQMGPFPGLPDYDIVERLGEGGMGVVWRAVQRSTRREVALKLLSPATIGSDRARVRFEREVELAARLEDPRIARVYDAGVHQGVPYYAMQLVEGVPLDVHVRQLQLDARGVLTLMRSVCEAVQHAHQRGIIHRDLKPSNILVDGAGQPVVVDFGLAKTTAPAPGSVDEPALSIEGQVAGTPAYMSPEQAAGKTDQIDTRSDVYSLGVILYRLLTHQSPHDLTGSSLDVLRRIAEHEVKPPRSASPEASRIIDRELETLLLKCLAKDPDRRYASAAALAQDITNYLDGEPLQARRPTATYILRKRIHRHRVPLTIAASVLLVLSLGGSITAYRLYHQNVILPIDSNPGGATIVLNGVQQNGCGLTPCRVKLTAGKHVIELTHPGLFDRAIRHVEVAWGRVQGDAYEPITLMPQFRTVVFATHVGEQPMPMRMRLVRIDREQPPIDIDPPRTYTIPVGRYDVTLEDASYELDANAKVLEFAPGLDPLDLNLELKQVGKAAS